MDNIDIVFKENSLPLNDYIRLKEQAFGHRCPLSTSKASLEGSIYILHAEIDGKIIGMARIIGDGGFVNFIADMIVVPEYQGMVIGRRIMERLIEHVRSNIPSGGRTNITLVAAKGKEGFYEKFGFKARPTETKGAGMQLRLECEGKKQ